MRQVREQYPYVLVDCPSLKESTDVLSLARVVDGFFIVVEANKTQKTQLAYVEQTLERAGGKILGTILNKRSYPIPEWFHNQLERWGQ
jgi:Mrp family chromosome partitioning ATPase